ncbi:hypothetical protein PB1_16964 [Bacillus methanolicus PB1]|uniref:Uncharacterized protein n=1 Tax=Bacillus methanolicus PB1 TaxID=997296 RepID=I3DYE7_BACMT|nr:hypothetical protein PB1_16964 [Bacillus methanolicus PB1]
MFYEPCEMQGLLLFIVKFLQKMRTADNSEYRQNNSIKFTNDLVNLFISEYIYFVQ